VSHSEGIRIRLVNTTMILSTMPTGVRVCSLSRARVTRKDHTGGHHIGQPHILALAGTIARHSKLLILDEGESPIGWFLWLEILFSPNSLLASSTIDYETDAVIQNSLRPNLGSSVTLLTIVQRLR